MAFLGIFLIYIFFVSIVVFCAVLFLGAVFGSLLGALLSTGIYIYLNRKGFFAKYKDSEDTWKRYGSRMIRILLILAMVLCWLMTAGIAIFLYQVH